MFHDNNNNNNNSKKSSNKGKKNEMMGKPFVTWVKNIQMIVLDEEDQRDCMCLSS